MGPLHYDDDFHPPPNDVVYSHPSPTVGGGRGPPGAPGAHARPRGAGGLSGAGGGLPRGPSGAGGRGGPSGARGRAGALDPCRPRSGGGRGVCPGVSWAPRSKWLGELKRARNHPTRLYASDTAGGSFHNRSCRALVAWEQPATNSLEVLQPLLGAFSALTN